MVVTVVTVGSDHPIKLFTIFSNFTSLSPGILKVNIEYAYNEKLRLGYLLKTWNYLRKSRN